MKTKPTDEKGQPGDPDRQLERPKKLKPVDIEMLKRVAEKIPFQSESAGDFIRRTRDTDRY